MASDRRRDVAFEILLRLVFRILLQLVPDVGVFGLPPAARREVVPHDAGLQRALVPVESGPPRVLRVRRVAPRTVRPHDLQVAEVERRCLRVRGVRLAALVDEDAA